MVGRALATDGAHIPGMRTSIKKVSFVSAEEMVIVITVQSVPCFLVAWTNGGMARDYDARVGRALIGVRLRMELCSPPSNGSGKQTPSPSTLQHLNLRDPSLHAVICDRSLVYAVQHRRGLCCER